MAEFWLAFGGILEAYGRHSGGFLGAFFKVRFLMDFRFPDLRLDSSGSPQGGIIERVNPP